MCIRDSGQRTEIRRGQKYVCQRVIDEAGREVLYILCFYLPRFLDVDFQEKMVTIFHELWHIHPDFNGDLRRHEGRCYMHTRSQKEYDQNMALLVDEYLSLDPPAELFSFLKSDFDQIQSRYGQVYGLSLIHISAVLSMQRAMRGFAGPADVFRNPQAVFCLFEPPGKPEQSPFDLELATTGDDFAVMGMHFKIGVYEHQSAGAIAGVLDLLAANPQLMEDPAAIEKIRIEIYEPAHGIIGDPAKRDPQTRQSADHSMVYIIATLLRKAHERQQAAGGCLWSDLMLMPEDYNDDALFDPLTRKLMQQIEFVHGGPEYRCV